MKDKSHNPWTDPEIEARIVALVLGEASDFEREELNRLMEEWPDLAAFKEQIQSVHALMRHAVTEESGDQDEHWKLPAEKRSAILTAIGEETEASRSERSQHNATRAHPEEPRPARGSRLWNLTKIAAVLCAAALLTVVTLLVVPNGAMNRRLARLQQLGLAQHNYHSVNTKDWLPDQGLIRGGDGTVRGEVTWSGSAMTMDTDDKSVPATEPATVAGNATGDSRSALEGIRGTLGTNSALPTPYYLNDDVQYFAPEREFTPPHRSAAPSVALQEEGRSEAAKTDADDLALGLSDLAAGVNDVAEVTGQVTVDAEDFAKELYGLGNRLSSQQPTVPETAGGELSFPEPEGIVRDHITSEFEVTEKPPIAVIDGGTVLLGGIKRRLKSMEREREASDELAGSSLRGRFADGTSNSGEGWAYDASGVTPAPGNSAVVNNPTTRSSELSTPNLGEDFSEQQQGIAGKTPQLRAGTELKLNGGLEDSDANGTLGLFAGDGDSNGQPDEPKPEAWDKSSPETAEEVTAEQFETWRKAGDLPNTGRAVHESENRNQVSHAIEGLELSDTVTRGFESGGVEIRAKEALEKLSELGDFDMNMDIAGDAVEGTRYERDTRSSHYWMSQPGENQNALLPQGGLLADSDHSHWGTNGPRLLLEESKPLGTWGRQAEASSGLGETSAQEDAYSTFSLHVSDVSFKLALAALAGGQWPEAAKVRIEEFVNAFDYGDPLPTGSEKVSCRLEQSAHPFLQQRNLLRISMRTAAAGRASSTPLRLTFVLDNSGSMERIDRQQTVRRAFSLLTRQLTPIDQVTLISFARQPRLLADKVSGAQASELLERIANLPSEGGTNIEAALQLAFEKAKEQQVEGAQNRIILLTDGAVNLGDANPESLSGMVTTMRRAGIAFDAAGICAEGLNDEVLEALTRQGDGRYYLLDSLEAADSGFADQIAGALRPSAKNVKVQVEFNPKRVGRYRLLGFEKHQLNTEDFRDDSVDAAEMAAAEAGVAMYQFEAKRDGEGDVGSVSVRFQDLSTGQMVENRWPIPYEANPPHADQAASSLRIAVSAALLAAKLRGEPLGDTVDLGTLSDLIAGLPDRDRNATRVQELYQMIQQARQVSGEKSP